MKKLVKVFSVLVVFMFFGLIVGGPVSADEGKKGPSAPCMLSSSMDAGGDWGLRMT